MIKCGEEALGTLLVGTKNCKNTNFQLLEYPADDKTIEDKGTWNILKECHVTRGFHITNTKICIQGFLIEEPATDEGDCQHYTENPH